MKYLVTGCSGFIGYHLSKFLIDNNNVVVGIDNNNKYYDYKLKIDRLKNLKNKRFLFYKFDLTDEKSLIKSLKNLNLTTLFTLLPKQELDIL